MEAKNNYVIIAGGGSGTRMKSEMPKQFLLLKGKPIIAYTIEKFFAAFENIICIVVLPENQIQHFESLKEKYFLNKNIVAVIGGETRFHSVKNGLAKITDEGIVAVHDAVRPFASVELIQKCFSIAEEKGNCIPAISPKDSLREIVSNDSKISDRNNFRLIQTPQCFRTEIILNAYKQNFDSSFTDDASVVERHGEKIFLTDGEENNIKITTPIDLQIAESLLK